MIPEQAFGHNFVKTLVKTHQKCNNRYLANLNSKFICAKCGCYVNHIAASEDKDMWGSLFRIHDDMWVAYAPSITCEEVIIKSVLES
jgi:hypothetical protein